MKILVLKPSSLGDVVQALPVLRMLKKDRPNLQAHWWISRELAPLLEGDPDLAGLFLFDRKKWARKGYWIRTLKTVLQMRSEKFDVVIDLQGLARSGMIGWLAGGKTFIGVEDRREGAFGLYDVSIPRIKRDTHAVDWYVEIVRHLGASIRWDFDWLPERKEVSERVQRTYSMTPGNVIALCPGARWENKRWPLVSYQQLTRRLIQEYPSAKIAIIGAPNEGALVDQITAAAPDRTLNLAGRTSLPELVEILRLSRALVTNDTGPMHIAAALGKPVIGIFGPTDPSRTGPYGQIEHALQRNLPCVPCMKSGCTWKEPLACLTGVSPEQVCASLRSRLAEA